MNEPTTQYVFVPEEFLTSPTLRSRALYIEPHGMGVVMPMQVMRLHIKERKISQEVIRRVAFKVFMGQGQEGACQK